MNLAVASAKYVHRVASPSRSVRSQTGLTDTSSQRDVKTPAVEIRTKAR